MARDSVWTNGDGLAVGFGTRTAVSSGSHKISDDGHLQTLFVEFDSADLGTSIDTTSDQIVHAPVIPNGALINSATLTVTEAFAGGTDIDIGLYDKDGGVVDVDGIDAAVLTAALTLGAEIACDGADINTVVATSGGVKVGVIRTGTFTAGKALLKVEFVTPRAD